MSDPRKLSKAQLVERYKKQEKLAKESLAQLREADRSSSPSGNQMRCLVAQTFQTAGQAMRNRTDIRVFFPQSDTGHDEAIQWIYNNIVTPAEDIRRRRNIFVEQPKPNDPSHGTCSTSKRHPRKAPDNDHLLCNETVAPPVRASFLNPNNTAQAYFLCNSACVLIEVKPGTTNDVIVRGPRLITEEWPCLQHAGFYEADAVLPNPNNWREVYFFSGKQYALVNIVEKRVVIGPKVIINEWPSLKSIGFSTIDAVLPSPASSSNAYFYSGKYYALVKIAPGSNDDTIVNGAKLITTEWPSLAHSGFATVDSAIPSPSTSKESYFFSGHKYSLIIVNAGTTNDTIKNGPKDVGENWPSLRAAFFY